MNAPSAAALVDDLKLDAIAEAARLVSISPPKQPKRQKTTTAPLSSCACAWPPARCAAPSKPLLCWMSRHDRR
jgi:hypothetical protein